MLVHRRENEIVNFHENGIGVMYRVANFQAVSGSFQESF